jgi:hypothetical protein
VDPRRAPKRVGDTHLANEAANVRWYPRPERSAVLGLR